MRTNMSWSEDDIAIQDHYLETENYEALSIFHAECASELMLVTKPEKGVFYSTTPFTFVEAQIHAQLSTTFATLALTKKDKQMEDRVIIERIIEILQTPGEDLSDGECIDQIVQVIETGYKIDWGYR